MTKNNLKIVKSSKDQEVEIKQKVMRQAMQRRGKLVNVSQSLPIFVIGIVSIIQ